MLFSDCGRTSNVRRIGSNRLETGLAIAKPDFNELVGGIPSFRYAWPWMVCTVLNDMTIFNVQLPPSLPTLKSFFISFSFWTIVITL